MFSSVYYMPGTVETINDQKDPTRLDFLMETEKIEYTVGARNIDRRIEIATTHHCSTIVSESASSIIIIIIIIIHVPMFARVEFWIFIPILSGKKNHHHHQTHASS